MQALWHARLYSKKKLFLCCTTTTILSQQIIPPIGGETTMGQPRIKWFCQIMENIKNRGISRKEIEKEWLWEDRQDWRLYVHQPVQNRYDARRSVKNSFLISSNFRHHAHTPLKMQRNSHVSFMKTVCLLFWKHHKYCQVHVNKHSARIS
jgi:hypothetical protein